MDNGDGTYDVSYVPDMTGRYQISVKYGGDEIPYSPFRTRALPVGDANKCVVSGWLYSRFDIHLQNIFQLGFLRLLVLELIRVGQPFYTNA